MSIFMPSTDKQYEKSLKTLCAHVNNLPIACDLPHFTDAIYAVVYELNNLFIKNPTYLQRFWKQDLPKRVESWIKNIVIYLFLKQKIQMNCVNMNDRYVFINMNSIYLNCNNEDQYYTDRFRCEAPSFVEDVFSAIQKFVKQFTRAGFLDIDQPQTFTVDIGNKRFEFLYTTNFFIEGERVCLYTDDEQALLDAVQSIDYNGIVDTVFENPVLSGKNFYDLFLLASTAQQFLLGCLQDKQLNTPLFKEALIVNQLDTRKALYFLASVITNNLPHLYGLRTLLNKPKSAEWKNYQKALIENLKKRFLAPLPFGLLQSDKEQILLSADNWHSSWGALTLMDVVSLPTYLVGDSLTPDARLPLSEISNSDYQIAAYLVYKAMPTFTYQSSDLYEPRLQITIMPPQKQKTQGVSLGINSTIEVALPPHLEKFLTADLRGSLNLWTSQMVNLGSGLTTSIGTSLDAFLDQITIAEFFTDVLGDTELSMNFSRRLGFYFWRALSKSSALSNAAMRTVIQDFLKEKMYLVDADMG
jgi:hypothetical protein